MRNVLLSIHCYEGDAPLVRIMLKQHQRMCLPIVIMSPVDSPVTGFEPHICMQAGKRAYIGEDSLIRQRLQMERLLTDFKFSHYLMHDADSVCLCTRLPDYVFEEDVFWSNNVSDLCHVKPLTWPYPRLAFQPPYFMSRGILERFVEAAHTPGCTTGLDMPFIDFWMMAISHDHGIPYKHFPHGTSCPAYPLNSEGHFLQQLQVSNEGMRFNHAIKDEIVLDDLVSRWQVYAEQRGVHA